MSPRSAVSKASTGSGVIRILFLAANPLVIRGRRPPGLVAGLDLGYFLQRVLGDGSVNVGWRLLQVFDTPVASGPEPE